MFEAHSLRQALSTLGGLLGERGLSYEIVAIGGGGLLLLGIIERPTKDLDALAIVDDGEYVVARPLPAQLVEAVTETAIAHDLAVDWLNPGPTDQLRFGLPAGFRGRTIRQVFGGLTLYLASRYDQICFKLYAAVDGGRRSKHIADLLDLDPGDDELRDASEWVKTQDASDVFPELVDQCLAHFREVRRGGA